MMLGPSGKKEGIRIRKAMTHWKKLLEVVKATRVQMQSPKMARPHQNGVLRINYQSEMKKRTCQEC